MNVVTMTLRPVTVTEKNLDLKPLLILWWRFAGMLWVTLSL